MKGRRYTPRYSTFFFVMVLLLLGPPEVLSQEANILPTRGKRFWTGFMQNGFAAQSLKVHILSTTATSGTVSIPATGWSSSYTVAANNVAVVTVPTSAENIGSEAVTNKGILVEAQDSVNVFISSFQNFTLDNSQVLPETSIGTAYRVDAYHGVPGYNNLHKSELLIVATQDGTQVRITPTVATLGGRPPHVPFTVDLDAGQTYQVQAAFDHLDLTGTIIEGTEISGDCRPFVVYGGSMCANIPNLGCSACDHIFEQLMPLTTWGTRYYTVPVNGVTGHSYRILAHENNTQVTIGTGAPINLNAGQKHEANGVNVPVCIQATKPVSVAQLLEGIACAGSGDPSMVLLSPADRRSRQATFQTPTSTQLSQHSISLVVPPAAVGEITLNGTVINPSLFQNYAGCADRKHAKVTVPAGLNRVASTEGFQLYMFGLGSGESYGASVHDIHAGAVQQDSLICGSSTITLTAPEPLQNIQWTAASAPDVVLGTTPGLTITPTQNDSYTVTGQTNSGCPGSFTYHVGVPLTVPTYPTANGSTSASICQNEQVQLALVPPPDPAWFDIQWSPAGSLNDPTSASPIASPTTTTWYKVHVSSPSGCGSTVDSVLVEVSPGAILDLQVNASPASICLGNSTTLTSQVLRVIGSDALNAAPSSLWSAIQGGTVSAACGSVSGTALYFNGNGQRYAQTIGMNTTGGGQVRFQLKIANGVAPCDDADPGENVVLEYSTSNGFTWNTLATYNENAYPTFTAITALIPAAAQGNNTMFRFRQLTNSGAGQDNWALDDVSIARYDNNWVSYQWDPANTVASPNANTSSATPTATGWYTLHATDPTAGCIYRDSIHVTVLPEFDLVITADTTLCAASGLQLNATPTIPTVATYSWAPNDGTLSNASIASPIATPVSNTTYTVNATSASGCTATGAVTITVGQLLDLDISASNDTICQGQQVQLEAQASGAAGLQYSWTDGGTFNSSIAAPTATPTTTTTYTCTVTDPASGCTLTESVTVTVTTGYAANAGADLTLCSALGHQLNVQHNVPNATYQWSPAENLNAANIQSPTILNDNSATYTVVITDLNGCSVSDQISITRAYDGVPAQVDHATCTNSPPTLTAPQPGVSYSWSSGQNTPSIVPTASGTYTLTVTNEQGCQAITTFNVVINPVPVVDLGTDVQLCGATSYFLDAGNAGSNYQWSPGGSNGQTLTVTSSGTYQVTVTDQNGCTAADQISVQFNAMPVDILQDVIACSSQPPTLDAGNAGSTFLWSTGAQSQTIFPTATGTYSVQVTTAQGCSATFDSYVELAPELSVDLGNDTLICQGQQVVLDATTPGATYEWSNQATTPTLSVTAIGVYGVTVSNGYCTASDAITVQVAPGPTDQLNDVTLCIGGAATLDAGNSGSTFEWNTGEETPQIQVTANGTYSVTIINEAGCVGMFDAEVQFVAPPLVELGPDTVLCEGQVLTLDAGPAPATYLWNTGATTRTIEAYTSGAYSVEVSNGYCQESDMINIHFNPAPERIPERQVHVCLEEAPHHMELDAGNPGSQYIWSTGEISRRIMAAEYGWYGVEITNVYGCSRSDSIEVVEYCPSTIFAPNTFTPNGDGLNDVFLPVGRNLAELHLMIFDRWGTMIFQSKDGTGWDGTYRGEFVTDDIYVWRISYRSREDKNGKLGMEQEMMGHIQVLR